MSEQSPVMQLLELVWRSGLTATSHSWSRLNHGMLEALRLAVGSGMEFAEADFQKLLADNPRRFRSGFWIGEREKLYELAVTVGNLSAAKSFEQAVGRKPFMADEVDPGEDRSGYVHRTGTRKRERLAVGFRFPWEGETVKVTSFARDNSYLTACSYRLTAEERDCPRCDEGRVQHLESVLHRQFRVTHADLRAARAAKRAARKAAADA